MLVANDNTYIINQSEKMYFDEFYFASKDHVVCDYGQMQLMTF
jgi:hypothetical protein